MTKTIGDAQLNLVEEVFAVGRRVRSAAQSNDRSKLWLERTRTVANRKGSETAARMLYANFYTNNRRWSTVRGTNLGARAENAAEAAPIGKTKTPVSPPDGKERRAFASSD